MKHGMIQQAQESPAPAIGLTTVPGIKRGARTSYIFSRNRRVAYLLTMADNN